MDRREVMIGGAALLGTAGLGGAYLVNNDHAIRAWIEGVVAQHLPGTRIDPQGLARFSTEKLAEMGHNPNYRIYAASLSGGVDLSSFSDGLREKVDAFERKTVSDFLLGSDFFQRGAGSSEPVIYSGDADAACRNPFAVFD
jgi:hypothetical protein